jgi:hypothetical protein
MPRIGKGQKALDRAHKHREDIEHLLATTPHWMLRGWFLDWAEGQLRRDRFYVYTDREHAVLVNELSQMRPCDGWGGYTVDDLVCAAAAYRADCTEEDDQLLAILQREKPAAMPLWLMLWLVGICRHVAGLPIPHIDLGSASPTAVCEGFSARTGPISESDTASGAPSAM